MNFTQRKSIFQIEEGNELCPKFNEAGLIPVITSDYLDNSVLMLGYMNEEALKKTIQFREAYYYSRSRKTIWHKGAKSGFIQKVKEILIDDDQDSLWIKVEVKNGGASCHVGYRSCFYRSVAEASQENEDEVSLKFVEKSKVFDPKVVYPNEANPTQV